MNLTGYTHTHAHTHLPSHAWKNFAPHAPRHPLPGIPSFLVYPLNSYLGAQEGRGRRETRTMKKEEKERERNVRMLVLPVMYMIYRDAVYAPGKIASPSTPEMI